MRLTRVCSAWSAGWSESAQPMRNSANSRSDSPGKSGLSAKNPYFSAFWEDTALPAGVLGPVESLPLARRASACRVVIFCFCFWFWLGFIVFFPILEMSYPSNGDFFFLDQD